MFWRKNKEWIMVVIFILVLGGVFYFGVRMIISRIDLKKKQMADIANYQAAQRKRFGQLSALRKDYEFAVQSEAELPELLSKDRLVDFFQELERLSGETGNVIEKSVIDPSDLIPGKGKNAPKETDMIVGNLASKNFIQMRLKVSGSFANFMKLLNKLENEKYFLDIVNFQIAGNVKPANRTNSSGVVPGSQAVDSEKNISEKEEPEISATINLVVYIKG